MPLPPYDKQSNILRPNRNGCTGPSIFVVIDQHCNGNMTKDLNKGMGEISYNSLNLPTKVVVSNAKGSATNTYMYAANGTKLSVDMNWGSGNLKTDYVGSMIYEGGTLKRILVEGGYIENSTYHFYLTDHLGNNRVVAKADGTVVQTNHYYPFGMAFAEGNTTSNQPYKYNGKEFDSERGVNWYDYSERYMDPSWGRFTTMDPLTEKHYSVSPCVYCLNNPIKYVDFNGMDTAYVNPSGEEIYRKEGGSDRKIPVMEDVVITGTSPSSNTNSGFYSMLKTGIGYGGAYASSNSGHFYTERFWGTGYYRNSRGVVYPLSVLKPRANGKYIQGYTGHKIGASYAKQSTRLLRNWGNYFSYLYFSYRKLRFFRLSEFAHNCRSWSCCRGNCFLGIWSCICSRFTTYRLWS